MLNVCMCLCLQFGYTRAGSHCPCWWMKLIVPFCLICLFLVYLVFWFQWTNAQVHRIHDLMDINTLRLAKGGIDCTYKTMVWNLSQNVDRDTMGKVSCLTGRVNHFGAMWVSCIPNIASVCFSSWDCVNV